MDDVDARATLRFAILDGLAEADGAPIESILDAVVKSVTAPDVAWAMKVLAESTAPQAAPVDAAMSDAYAHCECEHCSCPTGPCGLCIAVDEIERLRAELRAQSVALGRCRDALAKEVRDESHG